MNHRRTMSLALAGLFLAASAAFAADIDPCRQRPSFQPESPQSRHAWRAATHLTDDNTGTVMRLTRLRSGALQVDIEGDNLEVRKTLHANGDFDLALRTDDDLFAVGRRGGHLRVTRRGRTVGLATESFAEADLDRLQELLAGSTALRRFRAMRNMLAPTTRCTGLGAAVEMIDMMIGVLKGEAPAPILATATPTLSAMSAQDQEAEVDGPSCYEAWVAEAVGAWNDYVGCVYTFAWYNPLREVCAFAWVIRVESAWFRLIGCSSFPIKVGACDVESEDVVR